MENEITTNLNHKDSICINYDPVDNKWFVAGHNGWVRELHKRLSLRLHQLLGEKPIIELLPPYQGYPGAFVIHHHEVAILVVILSPRYVRSPECKEVLRQFYHPAPQANHSLTGVKTRVFKLIKTPIDDNEPEELRRLNGYSFYEKHPDTGMVREFQHVFGFDTYPKFEDKVLEVAWGIKKLIKDSKKTPSGNLHEPPPTATVYLAETESSLDEDRLDIKRELESKGYNVLPDASLPLNVTKLEQAVRGYLKQSRFSLHVIGGNYGLIPENERDRSNVRIQYEMAVERSTEETNFSQFIWMPREVEVRDDRQKRFIKSVRSNTSERTELMQGIREDLKSYLISRLKCLTAEPVVKPNAEPLRVYLICNSKEYNATKQLKDFLYDQNFEVLGLTKSKNNLKDHNQYLSLCDVAIIFQDQADEVWRETKLCDLRKLASNDPSRKLLARAIYMTGPMTENKERFRSVEVDVIKERGEFPLKEMIQFIKKVRSQASARDQMTRGAGK